MISRVIDSINNDHFDVYLAERMYCIFFCVSSMVLLSGVVCSSEILF